MENINFPALRSFLLTLIELTFLPSKRTDLIFEARRMREMLGDMINKLTPQPTQQELDKRIDALRKVAKDSSHYSTDGNLVLKIMLVTETGIKACANPVSTEQTIDYKDMDIATTKFYKTNMVEVTFNDMTIQPNQEGPSAIDQLRGLAETQFDPVQARKVELPQACELLTDKKLAMLDQLSATVSDSKLISLVEETTNQAKMVNVASLALYVDNGLGALMNAIGLEVHIPVTDGLSSEQLFVTIENAIPSPVAVYNNPDAVKVRVCLIRLFLAVNPLINSVSNNDSKLTLSAYSEMVSKTLAALAGLRKELVIEYNNKT